MTAVTFVSYDDEPAQGGQGIVLRGMRRALLARGHRVNTIAGRGEHAITYPRVTGRPPLDFSLHLNRHPELIRRLGDEVVHAHGGPGGVLLLRDLGVPLVYTAHHTYRQAHRGVSVRRLLSPLEARSYRRASRVLAVSESTARAVRALGVPGSRVEVLAPGVDAMGGAPRRRRDPGRLLFAGRWEEEKGVLDAVAVMVDVLRRRPLASAAMVGSGRLDGDVRRAAVGSRIELRGRVSDAALAEEYAAAAIVLMPSRYEGLGLVALEAQAAGAVVVATDVDGLRDTVRHGVLVAPGDIAAAVSACLRLIDDPVSRQAMADAGRLQVWREHSWETMAARLEAVYQSLGASR